jgi:hypothetical protein
MYILSGNELGGLNCSFKKNCIKNHNSEEVGSTYKDLFYLTSVAGGYPGKRDVKRSSVSVPAWFSDNYSTSDVESVLESLHRMKCTVCGLNLKLRKHLTGASNFCRHFSIHLEKSVPCTFCRKKFSNENNLQKHVKRNHYKEISAVN